MLGMQRTEPRRGDCVSSPEARARGRGREGNSQAAERRAISAMFWPLRGHTSWIDLSTRGLRPGLTAQSLLPSSLLAAPTSAPIPNLERLVTFVLNRLTFSIVLRFRNSYTVLEEGPKVPLPR